MSQLYRLSLEDEDIEYRQLLKIESIIIVWWMFINAVLTQKKLLVDVFIITEKNDYTAVHLHFFHQDFRMRNLQVFSQTSMCSTGASFWIIHVGIVVGTQS